MEVIPRKHHLRSVVRDTLDVVAPSPRQLHGRLHSLGTCVHRQQFVVAEQLGGQLRVLSQRVIVECSGSERKSGSLLRQGGNYFGVRVTLVYGRVAAQEVEVALTLHVPYEHAFTSAQSYGQRVIVIGAVLYLSLVQLFRSDLRRLHTGGGTVRSVPPLTTQKTSKPLPNHAYSHSGNRVYS